MIFRKIIVLAAIGVFSNQTFAATSSSDFVCEPDMQSVTKKMYKYARNGSPHAQVYISLAFKNGECVEQSDKKAWTFIKRAIRQRFAPAYHEISKYYRTGYSGRLDVSKANEYLRKASDEGYPLATYDLAVIEYEQDETKGIELFKLASSQGSERAKTVLKEKNIPFVEEGTETTSIGQITETREPVTELDHVEVTGAQISDFELVTAYAETLRQMKIYKYRGTTGSRLTDLKCGQKGSPCYLLYTRNSPYAPTFLNISEIF